MMELCTTVNIVPVNLYLLYLLFNMASTIKTYIIKYLYTGTRTRTRTRTI